MKKIINKLGLILPLSALLAAPASAAEFNYSFIANEVVTNTYSDFSCPAANPAYQAAADPDLMINGGTAYHIVGFGHSGQMCSLNVSYTAGIRYTYPKRPSHACYSTSCYYQALSYALDSDMTVQPLTNNMTVLQYAVNQMSDAKLGENALGYGDGITDMNTMGNGGGTSAMQGLLWSWRMLSNNWTGVWNQQSAYEAARSDAATASTRVLTPTSVASKHIVVITDGKDTDGPERLTTALKTAQINGKAVEVLDPATQSGTSYETCDAHNPVTSFSHSDYVRVCDQLKDANIKVHVILYGYAGNDDLEYCAEKTGGIFKENISTTQLATEIDGIVQSIQGSLEVKLVD